MYKFTIMLLSKFVHSAIMSVVVVDESAGPYFSGNVSVRVFSGRP